MTYHHILSHTSTIPAHTSADYKTLAHPIPYHHNTTRDRRIPPQYHHSISIRTTNYDIPPHTITIRPQYHLYQSVYLASLMLSRLVTFAEPVPAVVFMDTSKS